MLKKLLKIIVVLIVIIAFVAGYLYFRLHNDIINVLESKDNWRSEVLEFPLIFAGDLDYQGEEHVLFAPGWSETTSDDYFSYIFLWIIEENPHLNPSKIQSILNTYFDGLMNTGAITNFNFYKDIPETKSSIREIDKNTFRGTIELYDEFFAKKSFVLNTSIRSEYCLANKKYLVWFYLSPQETDHPIWDELMSIKSTLKCIK